MCPSHSMLNVGSMMSGALSTLYARLNLVKLYLRVEI